ncbi:hypothetical protein Agub_g7462, partial [Astrephomene gubernaculifera]
YNRARSLAENLRGMSPALLSRFDLIFVLLDRPDELRDQALSEHVMALHSGMPDRAHAARQRLLEYGSSGAPAPSASRLLLTPGAGAAGPAPSASASQLSLGGAAGSYGGG